MNPTKIILVNIPNNPVPIDRVPVGISRVIEGVDKSLGCEFSFIDIDRYRYSFEEIGDRVAAFGPQVIGFSAIITPSYAYLKRLSAYLRGRCPGAVQVLGGEMSVAARTVLHKTAIDFCVRGEAEPAFSGLLRTLQEKSFDLSGKEAFKAIPNLAFLLGGEAHFTAEAPYTDAAIAQTNWEIIEKFTDLEHYMQKVTEGPAFRPTMHESDLPVFFSRFRPENLGKRILQVNASKGCIGRCSFCYRFFKGYKVFDAASVTAYIEKMAEKYEVGVVQFNEENFGSHKKATDEIVGFLAKKKLNWYAPAVRANTITEETAKKWRDSGCVSINIGAETGSQKILDVMDKAVRLDKNLEAMRVAFRYRLLHSIGLMLGMPGETEETVEESIRNLATVLPDDITAPFELRINWLMAIPGTEAYEFAKKKGLVGTSVDEEDKYLEGLSDKDAKDTYHYLNFTDYDVRAIIYWKYYIYLEVTLKYMKKHGLLRTLFLKPARRHKYAFLYGLLPRPVRKTLFKYLAIVYYYGIRDAAEVLLGTGGAKRKDERYSLIDKPLREVNKDL
jgi:radical SAM superfamily enzyme YgiQ (UPF0313 family)